MPTNTATAQICQDSEAQLQSYIVEIRVFLSCIFLWLIVAFVLCPYYFFRSCAYRGIVVRRVFLSGWLSRRRRLALYCPPRGIVVRLIRSWSRIGVSRHVEYTL